MNPIQQTLPVSQRFKRLWFYFAVSVAAAITVLAGPTVLVNRLTATYRYDARDSGWTEEVPAADTALVLGAGLRKDGTPSQFLAWRVDTAAALYKAGKVHKLLMSGNALNKRGSEPAAMRRYAVKLGVDKNDIIVDGAGYSTYDSCYRAKNVFKLKAVIAVTQGYHVPRSVALCRGLGMNAVGMAAWHDQRDVTAWYLVREVLATDEAVWLLVVKPAP